MIVNEALPVLPCVSDAEQVTVVVPIGKVPPDTESQLAGSEPSTISKADALKVAVAPEELVASFVMLAGTVTTGADLS
jgi:hypothetical protein